VKYRITKTDGAVVEIDNPTRFPEAQFISQIEEPIITALIMTSDEFVGVILKLVEEKRGVQKGFEYIAQGRVLFTYEMPLNEIVLDFYDRLKSISRGYASFDYHLSGYRAADLVKLDILVAGEPVDALSWIVHRDSAYARGKALVEKMRQLIPRPDVRSPHSGLNRQPGDRARKTLPQFEKTFWQSATAATSHANASSSKSKKRASGA
jgi:GTP-binding protein LepA